MIEIDKALLLSLREQAKASLRLRQNFDLRTSAADTSQRMLNVLEVGTQVPIHRHEETTETVICIEGRLIEMFYEKDGEDFCEVARVELCPREGKYGVQIPQGVWHTIEVLEPSTIFEAKDGAYKKI